MKKIGFIDYFLDEWHANNYPAWIKASSRGREFELAWAWAALDSPSGLTTAGWCEKYGFSQATSRQELVEKSDCLVILSPDHPEMHEELAQEALRSGKPTYIDKTFAPDLATAQRLFALAEKHNTPMYSTSALRYAAELADVPQKTDFISARGSGTFANYSVHQLEMIVKIMGPGAVRVLATGTKNAPVLVYEYQDGRSCLLNQMPWAGFSLAVQAADGSGKGLEITADFWQPFIADLLVFFASGQAPVKKEETLAIIAMIEAGHKALAQPGSWIAIAG